jgi:hypothetical protein
VLALQLLTPLFWWARLSLYVWLIKFQKEWQSTLSWSYYLDNLEYIIYSEKYESTRVAFIWYNSPVIKIQNIPLMTHHGFPRWESGLSDILASIFQCTSELGLWIINIHRTLHVLSTKGWVAFLVFFFACEQSYLATWKCFSPSYSQYGGEWYIPLFLALLCRMERLCNTYIIYESI